MSNNINRFLEELSKNDELREKLNVLNKEFPNKEENEKKIVELAKEYGLKLDPEDFTNSEKTELDDSELESVSGGRMVVKGYSYYRSSDCFCALGGGGDADYEQKTCACVLGGCGEFNDSGKESIKSGKVKYVGSDSAPVAMWCAMVGSGAR